MCIICGYLLKPIATFALLGVQPYLGASAWILLTAAFMHGVTYGILHSTFNTLFGGLTPATPMATANSMCQTSNDVGNGIGMFIGSAVASVFWRIQLAVSLESIMRCMLVIGILLMEQWKNNAKIYVFRHQNARVFFKKSVNYS